VQVDPIQQWTTESALVPRHLFWRAAAAVRQAAQIAAGTGVHGGNQLESRWKLGAPGGTRNGDMAGFQWLAQCLKGLAAELRKLVKKQHAVVRQRNLTRARR
jgi:hypothetical protein